MSEEKRNITILINGKEVTNTVAAINREYKKSIKELNGMTRGSEEYKAKMAEIKQLKGILNQHRQEIAGIDRQLQHTAQSGSKFTQVMGGGLRSLAGSFVAPLAGATAIFSAIQGGIRTIREFNVQMDKVQAISGANAEQMAILEATAKQMGATTVFSASESAEAMTFMAMAGWDTQQIVAGLPGVLDLAAASGESLATTSDIVTDALTAFGMQASDSGRLADLLAKTSSSANTNVAMMGDTFRYVAPIFGAFGFSAEDAALATGLMANAGIKATQAGTVLRGALARMAKPTNEVSETMNQLGLNLTDADGNFLPFIDTMDQLRAKFSQLTPAQQASSAATLFGTEAMSGMLAIVNASEADYNKLTDATRNYEGAAKEMADIMNDNLEGAMKRFGSVVESLVLQFSGADGALKHFVNFGSDSLGAMGAEVASVKKQFDQLFDSVGEIVSTIVNAIGIPKDFGADFNFLGTMIKWSTTPMRVFVAIVFSLVEAFKYVGSQIKFFASSIVNEIKQLANDAIDVVNRIPGVSIETRFEVEENIPDPRSFKDTWDRVSGMFSDIFTIQAPIEPVVEPTAPTGTPNSGGGGGTTGGDPAAVGAMGNVLAKTMERLEMQKTMEIDTAREIEAAKLAIADEGLLAYQNKLQKANDKELEDSKLLAEQKAEFQQEMTQLALNTASQLLGNQIANQARRQQQALDEQREQGLLSEEEYQAEREEVQRKAFQKQKLADTAMAIINGALAVTKVVAQTGVLSPFVIPGIVASTAAQVALIQSQKYEKGGSFLVGPSHKQGGMPVIDPRTGQKRAELEGGEYIIRKRSVTPSTLPILRSINEGSVPQVNFGRYRKWKYEDGGLFGMDGQPVTPNNNQGNESNEAVVQAINGLRDDFNRFNREFRVTLSTTELRDFEQRRSEVEKIASVRA